LLNAAEPIVREPPQAAALLLLLLLLWATVPGEQATGRLAVVGHVPCVMTSERRGTLAAATRLS